MGVPFAEAIPSFFGTSAEFADGGRDTIDDCRALGNIDPPVLAETLEETTIESKMLLALMRALQP